MKKSNSGSASKLLALIILALMSCTGNAQVEKGPLRKYLVKLPSLQSRGNVHAATLRMTAVYVNMDKLGNVTGRIKLTGDYRRDPKRGEATWNNVVIAYSAGDTCRYSASRKLEYMEGFKYIPSRDMLKETSLQVFPKGVESVYAKNLVWDMMAIEEFAWNYSDSLKLNKPYNIIKKTSAFNMADIGNYSHSKIEIEWSGITTVDNELCASIGYRALYNKVNIKMEQVSSKGTEQYWGDTRISLATGQIKSAEMYSSTSMEAELPGFKEKFDVRAIREISVREIH